MCHDLIDLSPHVVAAIYKFFFAAQEQNKMFGLSIVSIVFGGMVCYKELLSFGGRCFRSCRRKQYEAIEVHVNSIEGLWLAAYLAKKRMAKTLNVVEYRAQWQDAYGVGEDLEETERAFNNVLFTNVEWQAVRKPMTALVRGENYVEDETDTFQVDLTNRKSFLHDVLERYDNNISVGILDWMRHLDRVDDEQRFEYVAGDFDVPLPLKDMSDVTTRRYFYNVYEPMEGWEKLEDLLRDHIRRLGGVFAPNHDEICTTIDVRRKQEEKKDQVNWLHEVEPVCPNLPYQVLMDLKGVWNEERRVSNVFDILHLDK